MRRIGFILLLGLAIAAQCAEPLALTIFHYNDEHSFNNVQFLKNRKTGKIDTVGGSAYLMGQYLLWRKDCTRSLLFDAGDEFTGGPISTMTQGQSQADILNVLHPDLMCVGNHEFDYGLSALKAFQFLLDSSITLASANLVEKETGKPLFVSAKVFNRRGITIGVIAFTTEDLHGLVNPDGIRAVSVLPILPIARAFVDSMRSKCDVLVALTHEGFEVDTVLANRVSGFDVIVGGHSHTLLDYDVVVNGTRIVQAGDYCHYLGRVDLTVDTSSHHVLTTTAKVVGIGPAYGTPSVEKLVEVVAEQEAKIGKALDEDVGTLQADFRRSFSSESNVGNWVCETLRKRTGSDIGLYNSGGIRVDILAGKVRKRDLWAMEPFGNSTSKVTLSGKDLKRMLEYRESQKGDFIQMAGVTVHFKKHKAVAVEVNGAALNPEKTYTVATNSYVVAQWDKYFGFKLDKSQAVDTGTPTRDALITEFEGTKTVNPKLVNWWHGEE